MKEECKFKFKFVKQCGNYTCKNCGEELQYSDTVIYNSEMQGREVVVELPIYVCEGCEVCYFESEL